jgi:transposase InsO family protein
MLSAWCPEVRQRMSWKGNCWDNACTGSFFKTVKREVDKLEGRSTKKEVRGEVFE